MSNPEVDVSKQLDEAINTRRKDPCAWPTGHQYVLPSPDGYRKHGQPDVQFGTLCSIRCGETRTIILADRRGPDGDAVTGEQP